MIQRAKEFSSGPCRNYFEQKSGQTAGVGNVSTVDTNQASETKQNGHKKATGQKFSVYSVALFI